LDAVETALAEGLPGDEAGWQMILTEAFREARQALTQLAQDLPLRDFAATLICAVAWDEGLAVGQIGDGVAVARDEDEALFAATQPQRGEYANETLFLTMDDALEQVQVQVHLQAVEALALTTDGLFRLALDVATNTPHPPFFHPLLTFAAQAQDKATAEMQLAAFMASERVCARTDDDKTLVLAVRTKDE
jgi:hypothetical protein